MSRDYLMLDAAGAGNIPQKQWLCAGFWRLSDEYKTGELTSGGLNCSVGMAI